MNEQTKKNIAQALRQALKSKKQHQQPKRNKIPFSISSLPAEKSNKVYNNYSSSPNYQGMSSGATKNLEEGVRLMGDNLSLLVQNLAMLASLNLEQKWNCRDNK